MKQLIQEHPVSGAPGIPTHRPTVIGLHGRFTQLGHRLKTEKILSCLGESSGVLGAAWRHNEVEIRQLQRHRAPSRLALGGGVVSSLQLLGGGTDSLALLLAPREMECRTLRSRALMGTGSHSHHMCWLFWELSCGKTQMVRDKWQEAAQCREGA